MLLILGSTFSVIFYFSSSNQQQPQALAQLKSRTYENPGYGYSIQYPANWMEVENSGGKNVLFSSDSAGTAIVSINTAILRYSNIQLDSYARMILNNFQSIPGVTVVNAARLNIAGNPAIGITYTNPDGTEVLMAFTLSGRMAYFISYGSDFNNFPVYSQTFYQMVNSFQVTPVAAAPAITESPSSSGSGQGTISSDNGGSSSSPTPGPGGGGGAFSCGSGPFSPLNPNFGQTPLQQNIPEFDPNNP
ncbi:MAG: hypothetical protein M3P08_01710 [Thermoproteota archaeon]|nr:hypothetical protein [Thermoproteota archaeon]